MKTKTTLLTATLLACVAMIATAEAQRLSAAFGGVTVQGGHVTAPPTQGKPPIYGTNPPPIYGTNPPPIQETQPPRWIQPPCNVRPLPYPLPHPQPGPQPGPYPHPQPQPQPHPYPVHPPQTTWPPHGTQWSSHPQHVSENRFKGINPHTGGIDTQNEQINNTYYDPSRAASEHNGTKRWVRRPVYGANGQVTGFEEGYVWRNSITGVEHGNLKTVTENNQGGVHEQIRAQSAGN